MYWGRPRVPGGGVEHSLADHKRVAVAEVLRVSAGSYLELQRQQSARSAGAVSLAPVENCDQAGAIRRESGLAARVLVQTVGVHVLGQQRAKWAQGQGTQVRLRRLAMHLSQGTTSQVLHQ